MPKLVMPLSDNDAAFLPTAAAAATQLHLHTASYRLGMPG